MLSATETSVAPRASNSSSTASAPISVRANRSSFATITPADSPALTRAMIWSKIGRSIRPPRHVKLWLMPHQRPVV